MVDIKLYVIMILWIRIEPEEIKTKNQKFSLGATFAENGSISETNRSCVSKYQTKCTITKRPFSIPFTAADDGITDWKWTKLDEQWVCIAINQVCSVLWVYHNLLCLDITIWNDPVANRQWDGNVCISYLILQSSAVKHVEYLEKSNS